MTSSLEQIEDILDHLLAGGDAPPHLDSDDPLVQKLLALARERIEVREGTRAFSYLSTISHELRTPLNAVIGYSELLLEEDQAYDTKAWRADLSRILDAGRHLLGLVNEVIEVARIESGHTKLRRRNVRIDEVMREMLPSVVSSVRRQGNQFRWSVDNDLTVWTDGAKLATVLRTLLNRAARVTSDGEIQLAAWAEAEQLFIEVEDSGERVTNERLARSFHPFTGGNGQGLTSTGRLVELIGGRLEVEAVHQGSKFRVVLPHEQKTDEEEPAIAVPPDSPMVLVVAEPGTRKLVERYLAAMDCTVLGARTGNEALRIATTIQPAVIALDAQLDESWETLGALKSQAELAAIPVVMLSDEEEGLQAADYLAKPFDRQAMLSTLSRLLKSPRGGRRRVLVVDDEPDARELARRVLASAGYMVDEVPNGVTAMEYLERERPDLILLDLMMPEMDGFQVLHALRKDSSLNDIPVVVLTAMSLTDADRAQLAARAQTIVTKGTAPSTMLERIAEVLRAQA